MWPQMLQGGMAAMPQAQPGMAMMPGNPMLEGLLASVAAQNPEVVANAAAAANIPPPSMDGGMAPGVAPVGSFIQPQGVVVPGAENVAAAGGQGNIGPWATTVTPNAVPDGMQDNRDPLAGLAGFKAPQVDNKPIMSAGVSGAQKAPEVTAGASSQQSQALQQLLMQMMQRQPALGVGPLGSFIGG